MVLGGNHNFYESLWETKVQKDCNTPANVRSENQSTLKELQAKEFPFLDSDVPVILDELLTKKVIALS